MEQDVKIINGIVEPFFETGTEGVVWSVYEDGGQGYAGSHEIRNGDYLTIWNHDGSVAFEGEILFDWHTGYEAYPLNPQYGQQASCGMWVHGIQTGFTPDEWGNLFFEFPYRRAQIKRKKN